MIDTMRDGFVTMKHNAMEDERKVRVRAAKALGALGPAVGKAGVEALIDTMKTDWDWVVRQEGG